MRLGSELSLVPVFWPDSSDAEPNFERVLLNRGRMVGRHALTMAMPSSTIVQILTPTSLPEQPSKPKLSSWLDGKGELTARVRVQECVDDDAAVNASKADKAREKKHPHDLYFLFSWLLKAP